MTHPTDDSLKPCPFCGGAASLHPRTCDKNTPYNPADRAFPVARCGQCGAEALGKDWGKPETAAEKWNARALLAEQARTEPVKAWAISYNGVLQPTLYETEEDAAEEVQRRQDAYPHDKSPRAVVPMWADLPLKAEQAKDAAEDAELLDWIFRQGDEFSYYVIQDAPGDGEYVVHGMGCSGQGKTPRAAIRAAIIADLCGDVEPVAWMGVSGVGERIVSKTQMYPFMTTPLYPAHTVAALAARVAELEKDAGRYRWLRDGELTAEYPYPVMRMGGSRVDDRTIWAEELDAAIDAAALAAKGQAS